MNRILDKALIFTLCAIFYLAQPHKVILVVPVLAAVTVGALQSAFETKAASLALFAGYGGICLFFPDLFYFLPLMIYGVLIAGPEAAALLAAIPAAADYSHGAPLVTLMIAMISLLTWMTARRTRLREAAEAEYISLRDTTREFALRLEHKNRELMEKQDYEVRLATLNERNRIAREIHDSVGHLLTSSILQLGAMLAVCRDERLRASLLTLKGTLTEGMDSIRAGIHQLYDESVDLESQVRGLTGGFRFCPVFLRYAVGGNPPKEVKYTLIAVLKEALSNVARHSNASRVTVTLREHPGFYQLAVRDNGTPQPHPQPDDGTGIGLTNIRSRVENLGGHVRIGREDGFLLFISIPREKPEE